MDDKIDATLDRLLVAFGSEILKIVPGKVSTEVDARFSFDTQASIDKARHLIEVSITIMINFSIGRALTTPSFTSHSASAKSESLSSSPPPGRVSRLLRCCRRKASTAT